MRKIRLSSCLKIAIAVLIIVNIFISFCPMITFNAEYKNQEYLFFLNGIALLVDKSHPYYTNMYDTFVLRNMEFIKSSLFISCFSLLIISLVILAVESLIKHDKIIDKITHPLLGVLSLITLILSCLVFTYYPTFNLTYIPGYGLYLFIICNAVIFLLTLGLNFLTFFKHEK